MVAHRALQARSVSAKQRLVIRDGSLRQTPPEKAMSALNAFVLFSVLASDFKPFRMPTMIARMIISPAEQTANETLDMRLRSIDS